MLELVLLSFRKISHYRNHKFGCTRTDPPSLEMGISSSAVRELYFEISIFSYLNKRNNIDSTKTFGLLFFFFCLIGDVFSSFFPMRIERLQSFTSSWEMWILNSSTVWSWFGLQAYQCLNCNHVVYKRNQRMRARFSDSGKMITCFDLTFDTYWAKCCP